MLQAIISETFPRCEVEGESDPTNSGNFTVEAVGLADEPSRIVLSPYGFLTTRRRLWGLLEKVAALRSDSCIA